MLHEFMEYRPYHSMEQFRREIGKYVDDQELSRLARYVELTANNSGEQLMKAFLLTVSTTLLLAATDAAQDESDNRCFRHQVLVR